MADARPLNGDGRSEPHVIYETDTAPAARKRTAHPALFRAVMAITEPSEVLRYASQYDCLSIPTRVLLDDPAAIYGADAIAEPAFGYGVAVGEPVRAWLEEAAELRRTWQLWEAIRNKHIHRLPKPRVTGFGAPVQYAPDALLSLASHTLMARVNGRLGEALPGLGPAVMAGLVLEDGRLVYRNEPETLRAELWLQLARAVAGNRVHASCERCGMWWELEPGANRSDKRYCSDACKQAAYRERKRNERRSAAGGQS